jgi:hypothetical protein
MKPCKWMRIRGNYYIGADWITYEPDSPCLSESVITLHQQKKLRIPARIELLSHTLGCQKCAERINTYTWDTRVFEREMRAITLNLAVTGGTLHQFNQTYPSLTLTN